MSVRTIFVAVSAALVAAGCNGSYHRDDSGPERDMKERLAKYATVRFEADLSALTDAERRMLRLLIEAAGEMDPLFLHQASGSVLPLEVDDPDTERYLEINYGPWDRLAGNEPFVAGVGPKPPGANFYPPDMTVEELEAFVMRHPERKEELESLYTMVRRLYGDALWAIPYHVYFEAPLRTASRKLEEAAALAEDEGLKRYLELRARALVSDDYQPSDLAWLDMKTNRIDVVIGPIETYEDKLFGYKAAYEAYVLVKDMAWSERLARYAEHLPALQRALPVPDEYKSESPGADSDLNAYDVVYYAGDCNAGSKTIAINLPNDEEVQLQKGTRRLQLKNAMRAKFDRILVPIADELIAEDQRPHVTFDAFFENVMFHEVAHGLGIKHTVNGKGTVREALRDESAALEEGKADVLGLWMVEELRGRGALAGGGLLDNQATFLAGIFRSVRFGAASAHGRANMLRFNFFREKGAFSRDPQTGKYRVEPERMREAVEELSRRILVLQGDGDIGEVKRLMERLGGIGPELRADLDRLTDAGIPVDVVFEQGLEALGLER